jgi:uncharacterized protein (TIGR02271 family)
MTLQMENITELRGSEVVDRDGDKIGKLEEIYLDQASGRPEWALIKTGMFGSASTFVPLEGATQEGDGLRVPYEKALVKDAPKIDADGALSPEEERTLYGHYSLEWGEYDTGSDVDANAEVDVEPRAEAGGPGQDTSGPNTDEAMTRSEEELQVGKTTRERGRARLKKYVVTEEVTQTVPVQREEVRIEREPITEGNVDQATDGPAISEEEHEVTLHEEQVVTSKQAVPKERVRLEKDTVTEEQQVSEQLRKEQIEADGDAR